VPAVGHEFGFARVLLGVAALGVGHGGQRHAGARHLGHHLDLAGQLDAAQLVVLLAGVNDDRDLRGTGKIVPALAADERVEPQGGAVPDKPQRRDVRPSARADAGDAADPLGPQERVDFRRRHGDRTPAALRPRLDGRRGPGDSRVGPCDGGLRCAARGGPRCPARLAPLTESRVTFGAVRRALQPRYRVGGGFPATPFCLAVKRAQRPQDRLDGTRRAADDRAGEVDRAREGSARRDEPVHQARGECPLGAQLPARHQELDGQVAREPVAGPEQGPRVGHPAAAGFRQREVGPAGGDHQVAGKRQLEAAADGGPLDRRDDRLDRAPPDEAVLAAPAGGLPGAGQQVAAGAEHWPGRGEHRGPQARIVFELVEGRAQPGGHRRIDRVALVRPVQRHHEDRPAAFGPDRPGANAHWAGPKTGRVPRSPISR